MNCATDILNRPMVFELYCEKCPAAQIIRVAVATDLYRAMNELEWGLIPTQHGRPVKALCPKCRESADNAVLEMVIDRLKAGGAEEVI